MVTFVSVYKWEGKEREGGQENVVEGKDFKYLTRFVEIKIGSNKNWCIESFVHEGNRRFINCYNVKL